MTACFKLMKALQPHGSQICESCVYDNRNLDPACSSSSGLSQHSCGLDFIPHDDRCTEMRTNNCSARKTQNPDQEKGGRGGKGD